jgi:Sulfatase-modifying factor enzyme 1
MLTKRSYIFGAAIGLALVLAGCSKTNQIDVDGTSGGSGTGTEGTACEETSDCAELACVYGYCRAECTSAADCPPSSICLFDKVQAQGGCRLAGEAETQCTPGAGCENAALRCGLDGTCRNACSDVDSCPLQGQFCVAGACVHGDESGSKWAECNDPGARSCDGTTLRICHGETPGLVELGQCATEGLCEASVASEADTCLEPACTSGQFKCDGADLQSCLDDLTGFQTVKACESEALCLQGKDGGECALPVCAAGEAQCDGTDLAECNAQLNGFVRTDCGSQQCNPIAKTCFDLAVDVNEVTRDQYALFLSAGVDPTTQSQGCKWNSDFAPDSACIADPSVCVSSCGSHPQVCVDWCDAAAYCSWKGQRLCGRVAGGMVPIDQFDSAGQSQWMNACSSGGQNSYPYGEYDNAASAGQKCNGKDKGIGSTLPVNAVELDACQSTVASYAGVRNLSGNVEEWEDACTATVDAATASKDDLCRTRGGSFETDSIVLLRCDGNAPQRARDFADPTLGFRCCD